MCDVSLQEKCAQYWPTQEGDEMQFRDTSFVVRLLSEDVKSYYTTRLLELQNTNVSPGESPGVIKIKPLCPTVLTSLCVCVFSRRGRRERSTIFITPRGPTLVSQNPQRLSSTSCSRCVSRGP